jgi:hypothetical protein
MAEGAIFNYKRGKAFGFITVFRDCRETLSSLVDRMYDTSLRLAYQGCNFTMEIVIEPNNREGDEARP